MLGKHSTDPDHQRAVDLLETVGDRAPNVGQRAPQLRALLKRKNLVEYEARRASDAEARAPGVLVGAWLVMALAALVVPWLLYLEFPVDELPKALAPDALWAALWPVLVGAALAFLLDRSRQLLPRIPVGDIGIALGGLKGASLAAGVGFERTDTFLRRWPIACIALLVITLLFVWLLAVAA